MRKLKYIDYLKGFSIFTIVLMHLMQNYMNLPSSVVKASSIGGTGVHIFILCSGFGLYYSYLNKPIGFLEFLKKRFGKVYVPYIIVVLISFTIPLMYRAGNRFAALSSHVFLYKMFIERYESSFGIQLWFISTIIQFYFIFYLLIKVKNKINNNKIFFGVSILTSLLWWIIIVVLNKESYRVWNSCLFQYLWEFSLGMILADLFFYNKNIKFPSNLKLLTLATVGIIITGVTGVVGGVFKVFNDIPAVIGYGSLATLIYINSKYINQIFLQISKISYEWYLTHILVFSIIFKGLNNINLNFVTSILAFVISIIVAIGYSYFLRRIRF